MQALNSGPANTHLVPCSESKALESNGSLGVVGNASKVRQSDLNQQEGQHTTSDESLACAFAAYTLPLLGIHIHNMVCRAQIK